MFLICVLKLKWLHVFSAMRNKIDCVKEKHQKLYFCCLSIFTPTANQCVTSIPSSSADRENLSIKHSRSRKMWLFPIAISALHSIYCLWFVGHSTLCPSVSTNFFPRHCQRRIAGVRAISDAHWKWQVNFVQLLPFSAPLTIDASVSSHSVAAWWY